MRSLCFALVFSITMVTSARLRPKYVQCQSSDECGSVSCCSIGMGRFSIPTCKPVLDVGDVCLPRFQLPMNTTLSYPDGSVVDLENVFMMSCGCAPGLVCGSTIEGYDRDENSNRCHDPTLRDNFNSIDNSVYKKK